MCSGPSLQKSTPASSVNRVRVQILVRYAPSIGILPAVDEQETVDRLAALAKPRLTSLLRLRNVRHVYDPTPGAVNSKVIEDGHEVTLNKLKRASQPYRDIERFLGEEKIGQYIVGPGLLPVVTAISKDIMGRK